MPMIDHIANSIQDPRHLITEEALTGWVRGGAPSRQIVRDIEYMEKGEVNTRKCKNISITKLKNIFYLQ